MALALILARRGQPAPNHHVGAVVVRENEIVGTGYHERAGEAHAEIRALDGARGRTVGATLYLTLEPCNHHGRTPPCVDAILAAGIRRVVVGCRDPNPVVAGGGAVRLAACSVKVEFGAWAPLALDLIREWNERLARP
jgi:diaminohydroxyphosphoribosylaminopyrimidine deaminase/5-amino-6-(5-phosphoribosylamino)uracil reductase